MVGVVLVNKFLSPGAKQYKSYIDYIDREEAVRNKKFAQYSYDFSNYQEYVDGYMNNPEKTTGLFTAEKDNLSEKERQSLKKVFERAEESGSIMWQTVISFDNTWLKENGLYDNEAEAFNEAKIREYARAAMKTLQKKDGLESATWSAAIHFNTDNIHVHFAMVEEMPSKEVGKGRCRQFRNSGYEYQRGMIKKSSIEAAKRSMVNNIISQQKENKMINKIIRDTILVGIKKEPIQGNDILKKQFNKLLEILPGDMRKWKYGNNAMARYRSVIDEISTQFINTYFKEEYEELNSLLSHQENKYANAYGERKDGSPNGYKENKIKDLYKRLGNAILTEAREYNKRVKESSKTEMKDIYKFMLEMPVSEHLKLNAMLEEKQNERIINEMLDMLAKEYQENENYMNVFSTEYNKYIEGINKYEGHETGIVIKSKLLKRGANEMKSSLYYIQKSMRKDIESIKNQNEYERMNREIDGYEH